MFTDTLYFDHLLLEDDLCRVSQRIYSGGDGDVRSIQRLRSWECGSVALAVYGRG